MWHFYLNLIPLKLLFFSVVWWFKIFAHGKFLVSWRRASQVNMTNVMHIIVMHKMNIGRACSLSLIPWSFRVVLLQCALQEPPFEDHPATIACPDCGNAQLYGHPTFCPCYAAGGQIALSSSFLMGQFKVLVMIFKSLNSMGSGYLQDCLSLRMSAHPTRSDRMACFRSLPLN